jgi:hypothetical protein
MQRTFVGLLFLSVLHRRRRRRRRQQQQQTGMTGFVRPSPGFVAVGGSNIVPGKITPAQSQQPRGELLVSVGFQPGAVNRLSIVVLKARNLPRHVDNGLQPRAMTGKGLKACQLDCAPYHCASCCVV